jgi:RNA polymerase sigma-B factor
MGESVAVHVRRGRPERERLILDYLPLVRGVARRYARAAEYDDLVQVGTVGLIKAVDRFEPARGVEFAAYARPAVDGEIRRHLRDHAPVVRPPRRLHELHGRLRRTRRELTASLGRAVTSRELAAAVGATPADAEAAERLDDLRTPLPLEAAGEPAASDPSDTAVDRALVASSREALGERERRLLHLRFFADLSLREIAREVGGSHVQASRQLDAALETLRRTFAVDDDAQTAVANIVLPVAKSYTQEDGAGREAE